MSRNSHRGLAWSSCKTWGVAKLCQSKRQPHADDLVAFADDIVAFSRAKIPRGGNSPAPAQRRVARTVALIGGTIASPPPPRPQSWGVLRRRLVFRKAMLHQRPGTTVPGGNRWRSSAAFPKGGPRPRETLAGRQNRQSAWQCSRPSGSRPSGTWAPPSSGVPAPRGPRD